MSLDYNLKEIAEYKVRCFVGGEMNPVTVRLIHLTMTVDLTAIEEKNLAEWMFRLEMIRRLGGHQQEPAATLEELRAHIGLRTNVATVTRAAWLKRWVQGTSRDIEYDVRKQMN